MSILLAALFFFSILTLWIPSVWPVTVFEVGIFSFAALAVARSFSRPPVLAWPLFPLAFAVLLGLFQLFTGRTAYAFETERAVVAWTAFLAVFYVASNLFQNAPEGLWFRSAMLWFAFVVSILATLQSFTAGGKIFWLFPADHADYLMGPIPSRNHYAAFVEAILPLALYQALKHERNSLLYSVMTAALYASVIASASRAGTLIATAEIVAVILLTWRPGRVGSGAVGKSLLPIALLIVVFVVIVGPENVWSRFWVADPYAIRREFALSSLQMVAAHPWVGNGLGVWSTIYPRYALIDPGAFANQAHSDWLQWAAEGGVPLALAMFSLFLWCVKAAVQSPWGLGAAAVFLHAAVDYPFSRPALGSWPILIIAMLAARQASRANS